MTLRKETLKYSKQQTLVGRRSHTNTGGTVTWQWRWSI